MEPFYFGFSLGYSKTHTYISYTEKFAAKNNILSILSGHEPSLNIGLSTTFRLSNRFELRLAPHVLIGADKVFNMVAVDSKTGSPENQQQVLPSTILQVPLQLKLNSDRIYNFKMYFLSGINYDYDFAWNSSIRSNLGLIKLKKYNLGVQVGLGCTFYLPDVVISPEIKFNAGLSNVFAPNQTTSNAQFISGIYTRMFEFSFYFEN